MNAFRKFLEDNKGERMKITKLRALPGRVRDSGILEGESYYGRAGLMRGEDDDGTPRSGLVLDGGWTMRTSWVRGVKKEGPNSWLVKTNNSVYRVQVA